MESLQPPTTTTTTNTTDRTISWYEVPKWRQGNKYILSGYRRELPNHRALLDGLKYLHNETCNVYTHILGALGLPVIAVIVLSALHSQPRFSGVSGGDYAIFLIFFCSAEIFLLLSIMFHLFSAHSEAVQRFWYRMDLLGMVVATEGTLISAIYYVFFCSPLLQKLHWLIVSHSEAPDERYHHRADVYTSYSSAALETRKKGRLRLT
ncbi:mPR-like GPCR protein [Cordyceps fumosorosea ARSEF 2679]|uniref:MPR-like GPCR protein n=1 Tax=Cordyceps fumosorosea (strain ARSEF 2679) TaxID=1081104 RepID=A0A166Z9X9_CORFA|nr:mPR-like GPCR protein [Cordyceps fumosorosea ARSEF 2679]OAA37702.1 mPR-like GPCR protein [Cordyceps fumosorosea ARSEF 2679]